MRLVTRFTDLLVERLVPKGTARAGCVSSRVCYACNGYWMYCCTYYDGTGDCPSRLCGYIRC